MDKPEIRAFNKEEWMDYKELRLKSLSDSPDSFGSTYEIEVTFSDDHWFSRLERSEENNFSLPLLALSASVPAGLAWGLIHNPGIPTAHVYQMWVAPTARGLGIGKLLLDKIVTWAKALDIEEVVLTVNTANNPAINLYKSLGFKYFGEVEEFRKGSSSTVQPMRLRL